MEIQQITVEETKKKKQLPPLIKGSTTYKMLIPKKVEEKIRYLARKFPSTEWSGVLFTHYEGSFETNDLKIICEDIYPMDLGNATFTEFKMDENVAGYIAQNIELFDCDIQLVHSHHNMATFFSGTDTATLREEGADRNCFVSLIVNNAGTYSAAVTRKIQSKIQISTKSLGRRYAFFGEGDILLEESPDDEVTEITEEEYIEYFMLDIEREEVDNPLGWLDERFKEIEDAKSKAAAKWPSYDYQYPKYNNYPPTYTVRKEEESDFWTKYEKQTAAKELELWEKEEIAAEEVTSYIPDPKLVHKAVVNMITCSLIVDSTKIDLKQWITRHMMKKYEELFTTEIAFNSWRDFIVEHIIHEFNDPTLSDAAYDYWDEYVCAIALAIKAELESYPENKYVKMYIQSLEEYL